ncbi:unnamed protein product, partial [Mesorhabditis belari]|uniref:Uncharacterized protein n=1 Tax=Mesorhabditis belari TaxID=2138241 RepID=A0AAF3FLQ8_9BILA
MIAQLSIYPWESAMMSAEMCLLATRQAARAIGRDFGEEFRSASQFQAKVEKLARRHHRAQLVLNNGGDFVVVKLHCSRPPVIVPIASKDKLDEFIKDMTTIMRDNDTTGNLAKSHHRQQELSIIPWESLPIFEKNPYIGRFGSVHKLLEIFEKKNYSIPRPINPARGVFICDPDNNLDDTKNECVTTWQNSDGQGSLDVYQSPRTSRKCCRPMTFMFTSVMDLDQNILDGRPCEKVDVKLWDFLWGVQVLQLHPEGPGLDGRSSIYRLLHCADSPCVVGCLWMIAHVEGWNGVRT